MLLVTDLGAGANQIAEGFIGGIGDVDGGEFAGAGEGGGGVGVAGGGLGGGVGDVDGGEFAGAVEAGELIGIAAVGLDAVAGRAGNLGGGDENANIAVPVQAAGGGKPMRSGFVSTAQFGARMRGLEFGEEFE